jgi:hypothetical protein
MSLYPLGISRRRDVPSAPKLAAEAVDMQWSVAGELACAFIDAPHQAVPPRLHAAALDAIHRRICVLPVRFGMALDDEAEIHALLQGRRDELIEHLDRLDSTCEMALRMAPSSSLGTSLAASSKPQSPLAYIEQRRLYYQRADETAERNKSMVEQVVERLNGCYRQWRKLQASASYAIRLAFLVEREREAAFRSRLEEIGGTDRQWQCAILGPWPPYSFV